MQLPDGSAVQHPYPDRVAARVGKKDGQRSVNFSRWVSELPTTIYLVSACGFVRVVPT